MAYIFANIAEPGVIAHHQLGRIVFGTMDGRACPIAEDFAAACQQAGIPAELSPFVRRTLWEKYIFLCALAGITALTRLPVRYARESRQTNLLWQQMLDELIALAAADGAGLDPEVRSRSLKLLDSLAPGNYSSLYLDLVQGKRLELEALHGHATRLGDALGVPTPALFAVYAALSPYLQGPPAL